ncbi:MAG: hypothetical protein ACOYLS_03885 [Polymorphobacter sp.]
MALIGRIVTALAGRAVARGVGDASAGPAGMVIGAALPFVAKRLGPMGMAGLAIGAWAIGKVASSRVAAEAEAVKPLIGSPLPDLELSPDPNPATGTRLRPDPNAG